MPDAILISELTHSYGDTPTLREVDLRVPRGSVLGLIGENGAGKTTLIKHILGLIRAQSGTVRVVGRDPVKDPERVLATVGYLAENQDLPSWMRLDEYLRFLEAFYPTWDRSLAGSLSDRFELDPSKRLDQLSKGQLARAALVGALAYRPSILVLDEPSSGLDPAARRDLLEAVIRSVVGEGRTVLFSSHLLDEVERLADRVAMIERGKVLFEADATDLLEEHRLVTIRFPNVHWSAPDLPGVLSAHGRGREWTILFSGSEETWRRELEAMQGTVLDARQATLEGIFLARRSSEVKG